MYPRSGQFRYTALSAGLVLVLAVASMSLEPRLIFAGVFALICGGVILARPFVGLLLFTFFTQLGGLINAIVGDVGDYVLEALIAVTFVGMVLQAPARPRDGRWGGNPVALRLAVLFLLTGVASAFFAENRENAVTDLISLASLIGVAFVFVVLVTTRERVFAILLALFASTAVSASLAALQYFGLADFLGGPSAGSRSAGAGGELSVTTVGNYFLIGTLAAALLAVRIPAWRKWFAATAILGASGILFTMARSALALLSVGLLWFGFKIRRARYLPAVVLLAVLGGAAIVPVFPDKIAERFASIENPSTDWTLGRRLGYHIIGFQMVADNPLLGVGPGNFRSSYVSFEYRFVEGRRNVERALHNTYLGVAAEYGLIGLALFVTIILLVLRGLHDASRYARDPMLASMAEAMHFGFILFLIGIGQLPGLHYKLLWIMLGLGMATAAIVRRESVAATAAKYSRHADNSVAGASA